MTECAWATLDTPLLVFEGALPPTLDWEPTGLPA